MKWYILDADCTVLPGERRGRMEAAVRQAPKGCACAMGTATMDESLEPER